MFIRITSPSWGDEETSIFISNSIKKDILESILTNNVLCLYNHDKAVQAWDGLNDVVRIAARFLNVDIFYTDGVTVQIPECGEVNMKQLIDLVECHVLSLGSFILMTKPELWDLDETRRLDAVLGIENLCRQSRKSMYGVVISCPVNRASDYELWILKRNTQFQITE